MQANGQLRPIIIKAINVPNRNSKDFNYSEYFSGKGGIHGTYDLTGRNVLSERSGWTNANCQIYGTRGTCTVLLAFSLAQSAKYSSGRFKNRQRRF
jgi:hypothetical protein